jgi:hypothetical protein
LGQVAGKNVKNRKKENGENGRCDVGAEKMGTERMSAEKLRNEKLDDLIKMVSFISIFSYQQSLEYGSNKKSQGTTRV